GATSSAQSVTVTNTGTTPLTVTSVVANSDFAATSNCVGASIQPQSSCTISVTFKPTATGERDGSLTITDNAFNSPQTVTLVGGVAADFTLAAATNAVTTQT